MYLQLNFVELFTLIYIQYLIYNFDTWVDKAQILIFIFEHGIVYIVILVIIIRFDSNSSLLQHLYNYLRFNTFI